MANLADLAKLNASQFIAHSQLEPSSQQQLQQLMTKARTQPLTPVENKKLQQLLVANGNNNGVMVPNQLSSQNMTAANGSTSMPQQPTVQGASIQDQAFASVAHRALPMTPEQIKMMKQMYNNTMKASVSNPMGAPKPVTSSMFVSLAPGSTPPIIRCSSGFISTLVFLDATGQPWPIESMDNGDSQSYNVRANGNSLMVQALTQYKSANLVVALKGLSTPVSITLMPGQKEVDYRVDMRLPKMGPNATTTMSGLPSAEDPELLNILDGVPPESAKEVQIIGGGDAQAWVINDKLYLRTRMNLMSPSWLSTMSSADGTHAYQLEKAPILLALQHGRMVRLTVEGL